jgi:hypothetical protein
MLESTKLISNTLIMYDEIVLSEGFLHSIAMT